MKPDDSSLDPADLIVVEGRAKHFLDRADAWGVYPTPVDTLMEAAKLAVAPKNAFDPAVFLAFVKQKTHKLADTLKRAQWGQMEIDIITRALAACGLDR